MQHLFDFSDFNVYDDKVINLSVGAPGPDLLETCCAIFQTATEHRMNYERENKSFLFQYGPTLGTSEFRKALAKFLSENYKEPVDDNELLLTSGASNGLHLILSSLLDVEAVVFVDSVTYMIALEAIKQFPALNLKVVPLEDDGPDLVCLESMLKQLQFKPRDGKLFWAAYYTIPTFHNPTGALFSDEKCRGLIRLSQKFDLLIVCDDVYNMLYYNTDSPPKRLFSVDKSNGFAGNVISNGSFSKILSPGVRIGWMESSRKIVAVFENCGVLKSGGATNQYTAGIITTLIDLGLAQQQLSLYRLTYQERMNTAVRILTNELSKRVHFIIPKGGYFIWLKFPESFNASLFNDYLVAEHKVSVIAGARFSLEKAFQNCLRICVVFHNLAKIERALKLLCKAVDSFLQAE